MPIDPHKITRERVELLRKAVEVYIDRRIKTPADFVFLADAISQRLRKTVSPTTLKRIWGYINDTGKEYLPGRYTLCVISQFIGHRDFEAFLDRSAGADTTPQSATYIGETLSSRDIGCGDTVRIWWAPDRMIRLLHTSGNCFNVVESVNAKLMGGDEVECSSFTQNAPLYFNRVSRAGCEPLTYIAGSRSGVRFEMESADNCD